MCQHLGTCYAKIQGQRKLQHIACSFQRNNPEALAGVAQLVGALSVTPNVWGWIPRQGTYLGCGLDSQLGPPLGANHSMFLCHIHVSLFLSLTSTPLKSINVYIFFN